MHGSAGTSARKRVANRWKAGYSTGDGAWPWRAGSKLMDRQQQIMPDLIQATPWSGVVEGRCEPDSTSLELEISFGVRRGRLGSSCPEMARNACRATRSTFDSSEGRMCREPGSSCFCHLRRMNSPSRVLPVPAAPLT
jgi:hypothetical protein